MMFRNFLVLVAFLIFVGVAQAQSTNFNVTLDLSTPDSDPPTIPVNLAFTTITATSLSFSWDASTDNVGVAGYQVFRDAVQIATTTMTSYADTGLTASTLYSYQVVAFDASSNYSTSSAALATTTLAEVAEEVEDEDTGGSRPKVSLDLVPTEITDLQIKSSWREAEVSFTTNVDTTATYRWGRTTEYEMGYISNDTFRQNHLTTIGGLEPGTIYELEIVLKRRLSEEVLTRRVQFSTESLPDNTPPPNVSNLQASLVDGEVVLKWQNPTVDDFSHVRVLSNDFLYPVDALNGWFVYEGDDEMIIDDRELINDVRYYTVFAYDENGNRSSGALVSVLVPGATKPDLPFIEEGSEGFDDTLYKDFSIKDLEVIQNDLSQTGIDAFTIVNENDTTFRIAYENLPEHLKTVLIILKDKRDQDKEFSFLLSINSTRSAYEAVIGALPALGSYELVVEVYDYRTKSLIRRSGDLSVADESFFTPIERIETVVSINWPLIIVLVTLLLILLYVIERLRRERQLRISRSQR